MFERFIPTGGSESEIFFWVSSLNEVTCHWDVTTTYCSGTFLVPLTDLFSYVSLFHHNFSSMTWFPNAHIAKENFFIWPDIWSDIWPDRSSKKLNPVTNLCTVFYLSIFSCRMARVPPPCLTADVFRRSSGHTPPPPCTTRRASNSSRSLSGRA